MVRRVKAGGLPVHVAVIVALLGGGACGRAEVPSGSSDARRFDASLPPETSVLESPDQWVVLASRPFDGRESEMGNPTTLWTGSEMIIPSLGRSPAFDPSRNTWRLTSKPPIDAVMDVAPLPPVWTGSEVIMFQREKLDHPATRDGEVGPLVGLAYSPATDSWRRIAEAPAGRGFTVVVWAGDQLLVWGAQVGASTYNPHSDRWLILTNEGEPRVATRGDEVPTFSAHNETAVWDGKELLVFPAFGGGAGAGFSPTSHSWRRLPSPPTKISELVWTGHEVLAPDAGTGDLSILDPEQGTWRRASQAPFAARAVPSTALWAGTRFVVWGGEQFDHSPGSTPPRPSVDGAAFDPSTGTWTPMPSLPAAAPVSFGGVYTGDRLLAWGATAPGDGRPELVATSWTPPR